jgi:hypothetical protein
MVPDPPYCQGSQGAQNDLSPKETRLCKLSVFSLQLVSPEQNTLHIGSGGNSEGSRYRVYVSTMPTAEELLAEIEITSLLKQERFYHDSQQWQKLRACYHPDASQTRVSTLW